MALKIGLREACQLNLHNILVDRDSFCSIRWMSGQAKAPWKLDNILEEVIDLARRLGASFFHVKQSANSKADHLAKGVQHLHLILAFDSIIHM